MRTRRQAAEDRQCGGHAGGEYARIGGAFELGDGMLGRARVRRAVAGVEILRQQLIVGPAQKRARQLDRRSDAAGGVIVRAAGLGAERVAMSIGGHEGGLPLNGAGGGN